MSQWLSDLLNADWIRQMFEFFLFVLISIAKIILIPFNAVIKQFFPGLNEALGSVVQLFEIASTYVGYALDAMAIPPLVINLLLIYYSFVIMATLYVWGAKLVVKWVDALK